MRNLIPLVILVWITGSVSSQTLSGEYYIDGQGGQIVVKLQESGNNQVQGTLTDMQGVVYQAQATMEDGEAFGTLVSSQGSLYFEAIREGNELYFTILPADVNGQPDPSQAQEFIMTARNSELTAPTTQPQASGNLGGPLGGQAAGDQGGWSGTFSGQIMGTATTISLETSGNQLTGAIDASGYRYNLSGTVSGNQSNGQFNDPQTQGTMNYTATLNGDQLALTLQNPANGQSQQFSFVRGTGGTAASGSGIQTQPQSGGQQFEHDGRLVGHWNYTDSYTSGEYSFAAQWKMIINPDGSYIYGDAKVVGGGGGVSGSSGGGDVTRGQWGTQNGLIYINDGTGWQPYCRYTTDGSSLLMQFGDGSKQLWKRSG